MSLNGALSNALGGLAVASRSAALVSSNISNALTPGYGQRTLSVSSSTLSDAGGVRVNGVVRNTNPLLIADRRTADASAGQAQTLASFASDMERLFEDPISGGTLSAAINTFDGALISAAADPSSEIRLISVARAAQDLGRVLNNLSDGVQQARHRADSAIASSVGQLNKSLVAIDGLNDRIVAAEMAGQDTSALEDQRQVQIDQISDLVPLHVVPRDRGAVALFTQGGAILLDGSPAEIRFSPVNSIEPASTLMSGALSGLTIEGLAYGVGQNGPFGGGALAAHFQIRDEGAPGVQSQLDAIALELATRFGPGGPDTTIAGTGPGVFTDGGALAAATDEVGLAGRLTLHQDLEPGADTLWKWRDGLGAISQGPPGDSALINGLQTALTGLAPGVSPTLAAGNHRLSDLSATLLSKVSTARLDAETDVGIAETRRAALVELELAEGVDTDAELQSLLLVEQSYAANARVITAVDDMLQRLLAI